METEPTEDLPDREADTFVGSYLLYLLAAASDKASAQFHARVRETGLRVPEWRVLACLIDNENRMITELAELSLMEQSRMTRIVEQMDGKGYLRRVSDPRDRRRVRVQLTERGRQIAESLVSEAREHETALMSNLGETDAARIKPMLQSLLQTLG